MKRVVVGLSGGVDSSVAAYLLKEQGYDVVGLFMRNWHDTTGTLEGDCPWYDDQMFAELTAKRLDIPFHFIDLSDEYRRRVVDYMFAEYGRGRTPNPDVLCNREIKFDAFLQAALKLGADYVATGHYCRREVTETAEGPVYRLLAGSDPNKDQSYFLCQLTQEQLSRALFPIGHLLKPEVRRIAAEQHLATAQRKDSQGICFVGKVDLPVFLQQQLKAREGAIVEIPASWPGYALRGRIAAPGERSTAWELPADGPFSQEQLDALAEPYRYTPEAGRQAGTHRGAHFFTIGQRKGLGLGGGPWFVIRKDIDENIIYVSHGYDTDKQYGTDFALHDFHFITEDLWKGAPSADVSFKIRHTDTFMKGILTREDNLFRIHSHVPLQGIAPGQFGVLYDKNAEICVGSGEITLS